MAEPKPFAGKAVLITGAGSGIGASTAKYLASRGASLSLADISSSALEAVAKGLRESFAGVEVLTKTVDVTDAKQVEEWVLTSKEKFGKIDGCVNSAGILSAPDRIAEVKIEDWNKVIGVNLTGVFLCLKYQTQAIADGGSIVNLASIFGVYGSPFVQAYVASKHGVIGLTKSVAIECAGRGVRVNAVCPSFVDTPMMAASVEILEARKSNWSIEKAPQLFHRFLQPEEVAGLIGYLLSDESKFVTKTAYEIGGGYSA